MGYQPSQVAVPVSSERDTSLLPDAAKGQMYSRESSPPLRSRPAKATVPQTEGYIVTLKSNERLARRRTTRTADAFNTHRKIRDFRAPRVTSPGIHQIPFGFDFPVEIDIWKRMLQLMDTDDPTPTDPNYALKFAHLNRKANVWGTKTLDRLYANLDTVTSEVDQVEAYARDYDWEIKNVENSDYDFIYPPDKGRFESFFSYRITKIIRTSFRLASADDWMKKILNHHILGEQVLEKKLKDQDVDAESVETEIDAAAHELVHDGAFFPTAETSLVMLDVHARVTAVACASAWEDLLLKKWTLRQLERVTEGLEAEDPNLVN